MLTHYSSWSKAAWSIFQSLFWLENRMPTISNTEAEKHYFFKHCWKPSQKMRLDALIIFHIEWPHQVSSLVGKQSKYSSKTCKTENHVVFKDGWKPHFAACNFSIGVSIYAFLVAFDFCIFLQLSACSCRFPLFRVVPGGVGILQMLLLKPGQNHWKMMPKSIQIHLKSIQNRPKWCPGALRRRAWK